MKFKFLFLLIPLLIFSQTEIYQADVTGSCTANQTGTTCPGHGHSWETPTTCKTCSGTRTVETTCSTCKGMGYTPNSRLGTSSAGKSTGIKACSCGWKGTTTDVHYCLRFTACKKCGGNGYIGFYASKQFTTSNFSSAATKGSTSSYGYNRGSGTTSEDCENCFSSGTYEGKNTRCIRTNCTKHSYAPWSDFLKGTGTCYTDACTPTYGPHNSNGTYQYDSTYHWNNCTYCSGTMNTTAHGLSGEWTSGGYRYQSCTCGYTKNNGAITYSIIYHGNGATGGTTSSSTHTYNTSAYLNSNGYYRTGYSFLGWSTSASSTTPNYYNSQLVSNLTQTHGATINLYAIWAPNNYTISFHSNGGTNASLSSVTTTFHSSNFFSSSSIIPSRTGYTFLGWYTSPEGGSQVYSPNGTGINGTGYWSGNTWTYPDNLTLYAHWERNIYTVTYHGNGGSVTHSTQNNYYNEPVDLTSVKASKDGFVFTGWNTSPDAKSPLSSHIMPNGNLSLYAIYSIPVSDIAGVYLVAWPHEDTNAFQTLALSQSSAQELSYTYTISNVDLSQLTGSSSNSYAVVAYDNAGNHTILMQNATPPELNYYVQTVNHYFYHPSLKEWIWFDTTSALKLAGETFTPAFLDALPTGYVEDTIDPSYVITGDTICFAYYKPQLYQVTFDPTGGSVSQTSKEVFYQDYYGDLPTPQREGHQFLGWYSEKEGGIRITTNSTYDISDDSTLYAHWKINTHSVIYDYWTNGGDSVSLENANQNYGDLADLSITATKYGWEFIGWNTDPDATTPIESISLKDEDLILYAIYKKDITAEFIDSMDKTTRSYTLTIYNRDTSCNMPIPELNHISNWSAIGWSLDTSANALIHTSAGSEFPLNENATFYGCYSQEITLSYDTNGASIEIPSETKERFFNASGSYQNPTFISSEAPLFDKHSFIHWEALNSSGNSLAYYKVKQTISLDENITLFAHWDQHPEIEAYDRFFTLTEVANGELTAENLLEKVTVTDREDGILTNGQDVIIPNFNDYDFTNNNQILLTYEATDSFGNTVDKTITIHIVDTSAYLSPLVYYPRFISSSFFFDEDHLISKEYGGLEIRSVWRTSDVHRTLLKTALERKSPIETWSFSQSEIQNLKKNQP